MRFAVEEGGRLTFLTELLLSFRYEEAAFVAPGLTTKGTKDSKKGG
jgi:hypothetical protein